jgi:hypothetical protein
MIADWGGSTVNVQLAVAFALGLEFFQSKTVTVIR